MPVPASLLNNSNLQDVEADVERGARHEGDPGCGGIVGGAHLFPVQQKNGRIPGGVELWKVNLDRIWRLVQDGSLLERELG